MSLDKTTLVQAIKALRDIEVQDGAGTSEHDQAANVLADAIEVFVKSGDVVIAVGSSSGTYKVT